MICEDLTGMLLSSAKTESDLQELHESFFPRSFSQDHVLPKESLIVIFFIS
jgi:hypothetical protein